MDKICLAYISGKDLSDGKFEENLKQINFKKITHLAIAFATIKEVNKKWLPFLSPEVKSGIEKIKAETAAQKASTKLLLSVGGAGCDGFCQATNTADGRRLFAEKIGELLDEFSLDGVDIDWEFPGEPIFGIKCCKHCKNDFVLLLEELRNHLKSGILTIAVGSNRYFGIDVKHINKLVDYVFVMTYDLGIMHSNIYLSKAFVTMWNILGISGNKLCIGIPIYGRDIKNLEKDKSFSALSEGRITHIFGQSFSYYNNKKWCFDTEDDVRKKAIWARRKNLGGIFCWEITKDDNNRILNAMYDEITKCDSKSVL